MSISWAQGSIAGVSLTTLAGDRCKCLILDGQNLQMAGAVNVRSAADGTPYVQTVQTSGKGRRFGAQLPFMPVDMFHAAVAAINAALAANEPFNVDLQDDYHDFDGDCTVDGSNWLKYDKQRTNDLVIAGVEFRFITV